MKTEIRYAALEVREDDSRQSPGVLHGVLMEYNSVSPAHKERFLPGALEWPEGGIVVNEMHERKKALTRVVPEVRGNSLVLSKPLSDTQLNRDVISLVRDGTYRGLSIEFRSIVERYVSGIREIARAQLVRVAVVDDPSYSQSTVSVRSADVSEAHRKWRNQWL